MKKLTILVTVLALAGFAVPVQAEDSGMLMISGNMTSVTAYQHVRGAGADVGAGILGDGLAQPVAGGVSEDQFGFFVDQVEIDLAKGFGENIGFRADLDFFPFTGGNTPGRAVTAAGGGTLTGTADFVVEQAYTTANIPVGNGWELLVGRFNSGIGLDPIDRGELGTVSFSSIHRSLLPHNMTGARLGYDWTDNFRWETFVVNNLADGDPRANTDMPSFGFNSIYNWGETGNGHWFKLSGALGPETATKTPWTFLGDMAVSYAASDAFTLGVEGTYRQDDAAGDNAQYIAGTLKGTYAFSDVWDGTLRYGYGWDLDGGAASAVAAANNVSAPGGPAAGVRHDFALALGYEIADGARFVWEGRMDMTKPSAAAGINSENFGTAGMFSYDF